MIQSIISILQPHTFSPSLNAIASAMASLVATNFSDSVNLILSAHLDSLAIYSQIKQAIIPVPHGMAMFRDQAQDTIGHIEPSPHDSGCESSVTSLAAEECASHAPYHINRQPFGSHYGSGHTVWYFSQSNSSIQPPSIIS